MKLLLITDEVWNDRIHGNNVLTNWFSGFEGEIAHIYCSPGLPNNASCRKYFRFTDGGMLKSILHHSYKDGQRVEQMEEPGETDSTWTDISRIGFLKKYMGNTLRLFKSFVWGFGQYDMEELEQFVKEFSPDLIFSARFATTKILRLERTVLEIAKCPIVAFTGDNEYSLRKFSLSPVFWMNELILRIRLQRMMTKYSLYYTLSEEQKQEYEDAFGIRIKTLYKCADKPEVADKSLHYPIRMVYAGKLYCGRWKTLSAIGNALREVNQDETRMILEIYTRDELKEKQKRLLDDGQNTIIRGAVKPEDIPKIYESSDIALHVESFELKHKLSTRVSFSTKIIDCLASGCAVMAIAWKEHSGLTYLKREDAAICIDDLQELTNVFNNLLYSPETITEYRKKATDCLNKNHLRQIIQKKLYSDFADIVAENKRHSFGGSV